MKKFLALVVCLAGFGYQATAADSADLEQKLTQLQQQMDEIRSQLSAQQEAMPKLVRNEIAQLNAQYGYAQERGGAAVTLGAAQSLNIGGDFTIRYQRDVVDVSVPGFSEVARDSFQYRLRIGLNYDLGNDYSVGIGLTGGSPGFGFGQSLGNPFNVYNSTDVFEHGELGLDYAFVRKTMDMEGTSVSVTAGQAPVPFVGGGILWDEDVRPSGLTVKANSGELFGLLGWYEGYNQGFGESSAQMYAAQAGWAGQATDNLNLTAALAYYHWNHATANQSRFDAGPILLPGVDRDDYNFQIVDVYAALGGKVGEVDVTVSGEYWQNLSAEGPRGTGQLAAIGEDPEDNDTGWQLGVTGKMGDWTAGYTYAHIEADSQLIGFTGPLADNNWLFLAPEARGHKLSLGYQLTSNATLGGAVYMLKDINGIGYDVDIYQVDATFSF